MQRFPCSGNRSLRRISLLWEEQCQRKGEQVSGPDLPERGWLVDAEGAQTEAGFTTSSVCCDGAVRRGRIQDWPLASCDGGFLEGGPRAAAAQGTHS